MTQPNQPVVTPALATAPKIGDAAPAPNPTIDPKQLEALIKERVDFELAQRTLNGDKELTREEVTGLDDPFNQFDKKLEVFGVDLANVLPGYHLHWINDERDRVPRMMAMGYALVKKTEVALNDAVSPLNQDMGENIAQYVGGKEDGSPMRAYLMKIPEELYKKRQNVILAKNRMIDAAIRRGEIGPALSQGGYAGTDRAVTPITVK